MKLHRKCRACGAVYDTAKWNRLELLALREDPYSPGTFLETRRCGCSAGLGVEIMGTLACAVVSDQKRRAPAALAAAVEEEVTAVRGK